MATYKQQCALDFARHIKSLGYVVYMAESGTYGLISDDTGKRVLGFQYDLGGISLHGYYAPTPRSGTGWKFDDIPQRPTPEQVAEWLSAPAPGWTGNRNPTYPTLAQAIKEWPASKYAKLEA